MPRTRRASVKRQGKQLPTRRKSTVVKKSTIKGRRLSKRNAPADKSTTNSNEKKPTVCEMKGFDSFGSDSGTAPSSSSSGSDSSLLDSFDKEKDSRDTSNKKAPQCLGKREYGSKTGDQDEEEIQFSFRPHIRYSSPSSDNKESSDSSSSGESSINSPKRSTMYLSRRMSYKLTRPDLSPIKSPKIRAKHLIFSPTKSTCSETSSSKSTSKKSKCEKGNIVKLARRYAKAKKR